MQYANRNCKKFIEADFYFEKLMVNDSIVTRAFAPEVLSSLTSSHA